MSEGLTATQRIAKNFFSLAAANIIVSVLGLVVAAYLARVLLPAGFGMLALAMAIMYYFLLIPNLGLPLLGTRQAARDKDRIMQYASNIVTLRMALAFGSFCLLLLFSYLIEKPTEVKYLIILYGIGVFPFALQLHWLFQAIEKMQYIALGQTVGAGLYAVFIFVFVRTSEDLLAVPPIYAACMLFFPSLFLVLVFLRRFGLFRPQFDLSLWRALLRQALPMGFSFVMIQIYYNFDIVMLGFIKDDAEVGYYSAAYKVILMVLGVGLLYHQAIFPVLSNYYKTSLESLRRLLLASARIVVTIGLPLALGGTLLARPIMELIYGDEYSSGVIAFQILIWAVAVIWLSYVYGHSLLASDRQNRYAVMITIGAAGNIALNIALIPRYGLMGASIATLIAEVTVFGLMYREFSKVTRVPFSRHLLRPVLACLGMGAVLHFCSALGVLLLLPIGAIVYFGLLWLVGGVTRDELKLIMEQLRLLKASRSKRTRTQDS